MAEGVQFPGVMRANQLLIAPALDIQTPPKNNQIATRTFPRQHRPDSAQDPQHDHYPGNEIGSIGTRTGKNIRICAPTGTDPSLEFSMPHETEDEPMNARPEEAAQNHVHFPSLIDAASMADQVPLMGGLKPISQRPKRGPLIINPKQLQFIPENKWDDKPTDFDEVIQTFFRARSTKLLRFEHKLWNALALTRRYPELYDEIGLMWVSEKLMKVDRDRFGMFINISRPSAALFSSCGAFTTHGFVEVLKKDAERTVSRDLITDVDDSIIRLLKHKQDRFSQSSNVYDIDNCRWNNMFRHR